MECFVGLPMLFVYLTKNMHNSAQNAKDSVIVTLLYLSSIKVYSVMEDLLSLNRQIKALI